MNFATFRTFIASLRPIFIWPTSNAVSTPGPPRAAQYRTPSDPYSWSRPSGVTTLPLDFDIFLRSGSSTHPEMAALVHGTESFSKCARSTDENNQVRMMSCACGRRSIGNVRATMSGSDSHWVTSCGEIEEVAQVSMTSGSPTNPPGWPRWSLLKPAGTSVDGSIGNCESSGTIGWLKSVRPSSSTAYQTGNGTPKNRCRLIHQSPLSPFTQFSYRARM